MNNSIKNFVAIIMFLCIGSTSFAQTAVQNGLVRKITHSKTDPTIPVSGVKIVVNNLSSNASNKSGLFSLRIKSNYNKSYALQDVRIPKDKNYILAYPSISDKLFLSKNKLVIALITPEEKNQLFKKNYRKLLNKYHSKENELIQERNRLEELQYEYEENDKKYREISHQLDSVRSQLNMYFDENNKKNIKTLLEDIATELAVTDYQSLDSINARIYELRQEGNWTEIRDIIVNEKMDGDAEAFINKKIKENEESKALMNKAEDVNINASKDLLQTLKYVETLIEAYKIEHINDSVSKYYKILIKADPHNWKYLYEAGSFEDEYMANYELAEKYHKESYKYIENDSMKTVSLNNMAYLYMHKGEYEKALGYNLEALEKRNTLFGNKHQDVALSFLNTAVNYSYLGKYNESIEYNLKAMEIYKSLFGECNKDVAMVYNNIGYVYETIGQLDKAMECYDKALDIRIKVLGERHQDVGMTYNNKGSLCTALGKFDEAINYFKKTLDIWKEVYGEDHPNIGVCYNNIGIICANIGQIDEALEYLKKSLNLSIKLQGKNHPSIATLYDNIGVLYGFKNDYNKSLEYYNIALDIRNRCLTEDHPDIAASHQNIGVTYINLGLHDEALKHLSKVADIYRIVYGEDNINTAYSFQMIAKCLLDKKEYKEAISNYEKALKTYNNLLKDNHTYFFQCYSGIGIAYKYLKNKAKANEYLTKAYDVATILYGAESKECNNIKSLMNEIK